MRVCVECIVRLRLTHTLGMKRKILTATAIFFICAVTIVGIAGHVFEKRESVPVNATKIVRYELPALRKIKRFKS